mmetsp:Transcript_28535/g.37025  ORF Transcript_28535/g.37025 Transcript_28535/m.37025 type:complete len:349 (-) Transcript_28535:210-1256(-)
MSWDSFPTKIKVQGAGSDFVNGEYSLLSLEDKKYVLNKEYNESSSPIHLRLCYQRWYISIQIAGLYQDLYFADDNSNFLPLEGWRVLCGFLPAPILSLRNFPISKGKKRSKSESALSLAPSKRVKETNFTTQQNETIVIPRPKPKDVLTQVEDVLAKAAKEWEKQIRDLEAKVVSEQNENVITVQKLEEIISEKEQDALKYKEELANTMKKLKETISEKEFFAANALKYKQELGRKEKEDGLKVLLRLTTIDALQKLSPSKIDALENTLEEAVLSVRQFQKKLVTKQKQESYCCICNDAAKSIVLLPCNHLCVCEKCYRNTSSSQSLKIEKCPICRQAVQDILHVYSS